MTAFDVLVTLRRRNVELFLDASGTLRARPRGILDDADRTVIRQYRPEIVAIVALVAEAAANRFAAAVAVLAKLPTAPTAITPPAELPLLRGLAALTGVFDSKAVFGPGTYAVTMPADGDSA